MEQKDKIILVKNIAPSKFAEYRNIYKLYLAHEGVVEIATKLSVSRNTIRNALVYMSKYNDMNFGDNSEIQIQIDKALDRQKVVVKLRDKAEKQNLFTVTLNCIKELRKNEELISKLKGLLNPEIFIAPAEGTGPIIIMHNIGTGEKTQPKRIEIDITKDVKIEEAKKIGASENLSSLEEA